MATDPEDAAGSDDALVALAQLDSSAFAPLYQRYVRSIYAYCYQRLGSKELAEDATSQVFTNALASLQRYRAGSFRGWLYAIARNVVTDERRRPAVLSNDDRRGTIDTTELGSKSARFSESDHDLRMLLTRLTPEQRDVVELRLAGLNGVEIAEALGKRHGAVRAVQFRAYQRLREIIESEDSER